VGGPEAPRHSRRAALAALAAIAAGAAGIGSVVGAQERRLFAFLPAFERARAIEEILESGLSGVAVTVFGRFGDFAGAIAAQRPEGALSPFDTLAALGLSPGLRGEARGSPLEPYVLLTTQPDGDIAQLARKTIGAVDIVGRTALPQLVQKSLGLSFAPDVRRVLQIGDLLPLLYLDLASSVVLPERFHAEIRRTARISLRVLRPRNAELGRIALAYPAGAPDVVIANALRHQSAAVANLLGVEGWT